MQNAATDAFVLVAALSLSRYGVARKRLRVFSKPLLWRMCAVLYRRGFVCFVALCMPLEAH